ncbi:unnamed protein product [Closterium sp. Yama58-4]|nr:unnamed protein product [Closterium sp. Yama58-4]
MGEERGGDDEEGLRLEVREGGSSRGSGEEGGLELHPVLEEMPKWKVLRENRMLPASHQEIQAERSTQQVEATAGAPPPAPLPSAVPPVLVACKDERTCHQLQDVLAFGAATREQVLLLAAAKRVKREMEEEELEMFGRGELEMGGLRGVLAGGEGTQGVARRGGGARGGRENGGGRGGGGGGRSNGKGVAAAGGGGVEADGRQVRLELDLRVVERDNAEGEDGRSAIDQAPMTLPPPPLSHPAAANAITRRGGGRRAAERQEMRVVVDMREFNSSLPCVLHQRGIKILPVTLEVGDYILSPDICVERKSVSDLFASFASGRLHHQAETMCRYYRLPVLLIEFSSDKSFSLQSASDISDDITPSSIISKMSLLALHFPRLRIVWSRSLHATAEIFASLKTNQDEPSVDQAMRVGVPTEDGLVEGDTR